jgi:hypothetical protein
MLRGARPYIGAALRSAIPRALSFPADPGLVWATLGQAQAGQSYDAMRELLSVEHSAPGAIGTQQADCSPLIGRAWPRACPSPPAPMVRGHSNFTSLAICFSGPLPGRAMIRLAGSLLPSGVHATTEALAARLWLFLVWLSGVKNPPMNSKNRSCCLLKRRSP